jgi:hypothetical protein
MTLGGVILYDYERDRTRIEKETQSPADHPPPHDHHRSTTTMSLMGKREATRISAMSPLKVEASCFSHRSGKDTTTTTKTNVKAAAVTLFDATMWKQIQQVRRDPITLCTSPNNISVAVRVLSPRRTSRAALPVTTMRNTSASTPEDENESSAFVYVRDFTLDPRKLCTGESTRSVVRLLIRANTIECASSKWARAYFRYVRYGLRQGQLTRTSRLY